MPLIQSSIFCTPSSTKLTTLTNAPIIHQRGALSTSLFGQEVSQRRINDIGYSTAFYWTDAVLDTIDTIIPKLKDGNIIVQERYDLSITSFREIHGFKDDTLLLDTFLQRGMLIHPHLTILAQADCATVSERIINGTDSSSIDHDFLNHLEKITAMTESIRGHIVRLHRNHIILDTQKHSINECINQIITAINKIP